MSYNPIRIGQLIAPFGPGSLYTDRHGTPLVVCGLDHWYMSRDDMPDLKPGEFERVEPRLSALLKIDRFRIPPDYRIALQGRVPPPNAMLEIPVQRFPCWYRNTRTGVLRRFNLSTEHLDKPEGGGRWQPVRFISVCAAGHLCEFPWKEWIECDCNGDGQLVLTDHGGSELSSIRVECTSCRRARSLAGSTMRPEHDQKSPFQEKGIMCPGERPWLGAGANEPCSEVLVGALINQTNIYFPRIASAIALPDFDPELSNNLDLKREIELEKGLLGMVKSMWRTDQQSAAVDAMQGNLRRRGVACESEEIRLVLDSIFNSSASVAIPDNRQPALPEPELLTFRRAEFEILRNEVDDPIHVPNLVVIGTELKPELSPWLERVNLVERLKETRVFYGFDRLEPSTEPLMGMPDTAMHQLFRISPTQKQDEWLPAIEVFGEGLFIELNEDQIISWQTRNADWMVNRIDDAFLARLAGVYQTMPPCYSPGRDWASRYLMIHSLAHILINQLVFECGYSSASLRERLYISADPDAPMAAFLIYTAAGDSDGSLGGLIQLGRPERLEPTLRRALSRASWCSADPICSEQLGGRGSRLANHAACHACILLPETSCETINQGLDRAMVVGTPEERQVGFFANLIEQEHVV